MFTRKLAKITGTLKKYEYEMYDEQRLNNPGRLTLCKEAWGTFMITSRRPFPESPENLSGPKPIRKTPSGLFWKASLFICCKGNKK